MISLQFTSTFFVSQQDPAKANTLQVVKCHCRIENIYDPSKNLVTTMKFKKHTHHCDLTVPYQYGVNPYVKYAVRKFVVSNDLRQFNGPKCKQFLREFYTESENPEAR